MPDPTFGLAAFQLGHSYEALGDLEAARRAYEQALRTLGPDEDERSESMLEQVSLEDVRAATTSRIDALRRESALSSVIVRATSPQWRG
jgi:tetratricopeptide (TPR) repeat protein